MDTSVPGWENAQLRFFAHRIIGAGEEKRASSDAFSRASESGNKRNFEEMAQLIARPAID